MSDNLFTDAADSYVGKLFSNPPTFTNSSIYIYSDFNISYATFTDMSVTSGNVWYIPQYYDDTIDTEDFKLVQLLSRKYKDALNTDMSPLLGGFIYSDDTPFIPNEIFGLNMDQLIELWITKYKVNPFIDVPGLENYDIDNYNKEQVLELLADELIAEGLMSAGETLDSYEEYTNFSMEAIGISLEAGYTFGDVFFATIKEMLPVSISSQINSLADCIGLMLNGYGSKSKSASYYNNSKVDITDNTVLASALFGDQNYQDTFFNLCILQDENSSEPVKINLSNAIHNKTTITSLLINDQPVEFARLADGSYSITLPNKVGEYVIKIKTSYDGNTLFDDVAYKTGEFTIAANITSNTQAAILSGKINGKDITIDSQKKTISAYIQNFDINNIDISGLLGSYNGTISKVIRDGKLYIAITSEDKSTVTEYLFVNTYTATPAIPATGDNNILFVLIGIFAIIALIALFVFSKLRKTK